MKTIIIVKPREGKSLLAWPDQVTVQVRRFRAGRHLIHPWLYSVTGFSTLVEYLPTTIVPLDRDILLDLMKQWREMYGRGRWDFYLKPKDHHITPFDPRRKKIYFIKEGP